MFSRFVATLIMYILRASGSFPAHMLSLSHERSKGRLSGKTGGGGGGGGRGAQMNIRPK